MKNYKDLTKKLMFLYDQIENDQISIIKADKMIKTANAIDRQMKGKLLSIILTSEKNKIDFYKD